MLNRVTASTLHQHNQGVLHGITDPASSTHSRSSYATPQAEGKLSPDGKKIPTCGRGAS